jgi:hypothetical protein
MASIIQLFVSVTFVLTLVYANSLLSTSTLVAEASSSPVEPTVAYKYGGCNSTADCSGHGQCIQNGTECHCERGWTTNGPLADKNRPCSYQQSSKRTAFFLSFFLGIFGVDWFYLARHNLGYIFAGILKLLIGCGCWGVWCLSYFGPQIQSLKTVEPKLRGVSTFCSLLAFTWWIVDWIRVLSNKFPDGNGVRLTPW